MTTKTWFLVFLVDFLVFFLALLAFSALLWVKLKSIGVVY